MKRILVTGAAGFLGFHLARALARQPATQVICVDNFVRGELDDHYLQLTSQPNVERYDLDLNREAAVASLPDDVDIIYHLAALNGTQNFYNRPLEVIRCCTLPTMHLVEKYGPQRRIRRFVHAGTCEAYSSTVTRFGWEIPTDETVPLSIDDVFNPRWSYAASKLHGEIVLTQSGRIFGMPFSIIRYHNAYGPRMGDKHVIPDFLARASEGRFVLYGFEDTRSFIYVDDAVAATILVGETEACRDQIVNVGGEAEITMLDLAKLLMRLNGMTGDIEKHPSPQGSVRRRAPNLGKLRRLTGFKERWSFEDGLVATSQFYLRGDLVAPRFAA